DPAPQGRADQLARLLPADQQHRHVRGALLEGAGQRERVAVAEAGPEAGRQYVAALGGHGGHGLVGVGRPHHPVGQPGQRIAGQPGGVAVMRFDDEDRHHGFPKMSFSSAAGPTPVDSSASGGRRARSMEPSSAANITFVTSSLLTASVTAVSVWLPFPWLTRPLLPCAARVRAVAPTARTRASGRTFRVLSRPSLPAGLVSATP